MTLGSRLVDLRAVQTQSEAADGLGYSKNALAHWENDRNMPGAVALIVLADYYKVSVDWLLVGPGPRKTRSVVGNAEFRAIPRTRGAMDWAYACLALFVCNHGGRSKVGKKQFFTCSVPALHLEVSRGSNGYLLTFI